VASVISAGLPESFNLT